MRSTLLFVALGLVGLGCDSLKKSNEPVRIDSVANAPQHYEVKRLEFTGTPKPELMGTHSWRNRPNARGSVGSGSALYMHVVPVVPADWSPEQPVPLWVTGKHMDEKPSGWVASLTALEAGHVIGKVQDYAGREPGMRTTSGWQKAIADAETKHGTKSDPHAPIVMFPDPDAK